MNYKFPIANPSLLEFITVIEKEAQHQVDKMDDVQKERCCHCTLLEDLTLCEIPKEYATLKYVNVDNYI